MLNLAWRKHIEKPTVTNFEEVSNHKKIRLPDEGQNIVSKDTIIAVINVSSFCYLKYKNLQPCCLIQKNQFIDAYTLLGYLEAVTNNSLEIVKFKVKKKDSKQILLISNKDCLTLQKSQFPDKKLNDFIIDSNNVNETGKIIIANDQFLTLQKGRPYFFPNCKNEKVIDSMIIKK